jgi:hypothetical protein
MTSSRHLNQKHYIDKAPPGIVYVLMLAIYSSISFCVVFESMQTFFEAIVNLLTALKLFALDQHDQVRWSHFK